MNNDDVVTANQTIVAAQSLANSLYGIDTSANVTTSVNATTSKARFEFLRNSNIGVGSMVDHQSAKGDTVVKISSDGSRFATSCGYELVTSRDPETYGYVYHSRYTHARYNPVIAHVKWIKNEDFEHDGAFTSFTRDGNMFHFVNGVTGATMSIDLLNTRNNIIGVANIQEGPKKFSCVDILENVFFYIQGEDGEFNLPISSMRIFTDEAMADRFIESGKKFLEEERKKLDAIREKRRGLEEGMYVEIDVSSLDDSTVKRECSVILDGSISSLKSYLQNNDGAVFKILSITDASVSYASVAGFDNYNSRYVPISILVPSTEEKWKIFQKNKNLIKMRSKILEATSRELEGQTRSVKEIWVDLIHRMRKESEIMQKLEGVRSGEIDAAQELLNGLLSEIEDVKKDKRILSADLDESNLTVSIKTKDMFIKKIVDIRSNDKDITKLILKKPLKIGKFDITINMIKPEITAVRKSRISGINGNHPHISSHICWGNMADIVPKELANMKIYQVVQTLLEIIENVRIHDTYGSLGSYWDKSPYSDMCVCGSGGVDRLKRDGNIRNSSMIPGNADTEPETEDNDDDTPSARPVAGNTIFTWASSDF